MATREATPAGRVRRRKRAEAPRQRGFGRAFLPLALVASLVLVGATLLANRSTDPPADSTLPSTRDYHALLVDPDDPARLVLGTHAGLYASHDGGLTWTEGALRGDDAMNLVRTPAGVTWAAGHGVLARSADGGATWRDVSPDGLPPSLDVHGFAADPASGARLYAAIAHEGLYHSGDGGGSFELVSERVGGDVYGLAVAPSGRLFAADRERGVLVSDDRGRSWRESLADGATGVAVSPADPRLVLASTPRGVYRSETQGAGWALALPLAEGAGPLAWSPSNPRVAYAIGFDKRLYRSLDAGVTWRRLIGARA